jgi:hypothetical protein
MMRSEQMAHAVINFEEKLLLVTGQWSPKIVAQLNDYHQISGADAPAFRPGEEAPCLAFKSDLC